VAASVYWYVKQVPGGKHVRKVVIMLGVVILLAAVVAGALAVGQPASAAPKNPPPAGSPSLEDRLQALEATVAELTEELALANATIATQETAIGELTDDLAAANTAIAAIDVEGLDGRLAVVEANKALALHPYVEVTTDTLNGVKGPNILFTGANLHVRNGWATTASTNGLGNLIVGYNETRSGLRTGSHNLVVGPRHLWASYGGFLAGSNNSAFAAFASVSGGADNIASGAYSSVSGGAGGEAKGFVSSVSGGFDNTAEGGYSSVSGGYARSAVGPYYWRAGELLETDTP
jgi:hypothetical protein